MFDNKITSIIILESRGNADPASQVKVILDLEIISGIVR